MKRNSLVVVMFILASFVILLAGGAVAAQQGGGPGEKMGPPPGAAGDDRQIMQGGGDSNGPMPPGKRGGPEGMKDRKPPVPPVLYIGYAVRAENDFEMACVNIFPPRDAEEGDAGAKIKKPAGTIEIAKKKYFIVEAKIETQEASLQMFPKEAKEHGLKPPSIIKTLSAKISTSYFESVDGPPAPGQGDKMKMPEGTANIVGDITLASVEKEAGDRKLIMASGAVNTGEEKLSLYLEPRVIDARPPRDMMQQNRRGGGPGGKPGRGGKGGPGMNGGNGGPGGGQQQPGQPQSGE